MMRSCCGWLVLCAVDLSSSRLPRWSSIPWSASTFAVVWSSRCSSCSFCTRLFPWWLFAVASKVADFKTVVALPSRRRIATISTFATALRTGLAARVPTVLRDVAGPATVVTSAFPLNLLLNSADVLGRQGSRVYGREEVVQLLVVHLSFTDVFFTAILVEHLLVVVLKAFSAHVLRHEAPATHHQATATAGANTW